MSITDLDAGSYYEYEILPVEVTDGQMSLLAADDHILA